MAVPLEVFCCYAREDQEMLAQLKKHLASLQRQSQIIVWSDVDLKAGVEWEKVLRQHLESADIVLLLISPDFMASDYCYSKEMEWALERDKKGEARVVPIILRPVDWRDAPFARLQCLPRDAKAVTTWSNSDEAFLDIAEGIRLVCVELLGASPPPSLRKTGIDKVKGGKIVRAENIVFPNSSWHIQTRSKDLQPTFNNIITDWTQDFVGRQYIFNELDKFLREEASGYFIIEGDPGIGKTALIAQLVKERGYLHHFNTRIQSITDPDLFLESICVQLNSLFQLGYILKLEKNADKDGEKGTVLNDLLGTPPK